MGAGLDQDSLSHLTEVLGGYVERGEVPGLVALIGRGDDVHVDALGLTARRASAPIRRDTIFRVASMTKPVAAAAALILVNEGRLRLDEPVDEWLPELANRSVLRTPGSPLDDTVPAQRAITLRDLLTLRMGFGHILDDRGPYPVIQAAFEERVLAGHTNPAAMLAPDEWLHRLGSLPLVHQPGETFMYDTGMDVLGILISRVAGIPLDAFLAERIFGPLGMRDTAFSVPAEDAMRLTACYLPAEDGSLDTFDSPGTASAWAQPPIFPAAASGLVSTADDFLTFSRMLLGSSGGDAGILPPGSVDLMTTNHLTPAQRAHGQVILGPGRGWGLGMAVDVEATLPGMARGRFGWDGGLGTSWACNPGTGLIGVLLTNVCFTTPEPPPVVQDFWRLASQVVSA